MGPVSVQLSKKYFSETLFPGDRLPDCVRVRHVSFAWSKVRLNELIVGPEVFSVQEFFVDGCGDGSGSEEEGIRRGGGAHHGTGAAAGEGGHLPETVRTPRGPPRETEGTVGREAPSPKGSRPGRAAPAQGEGG